MNLAKTAIKRPVSVVLIMLALVVFGISSVFSASLELMPKMEIPMLVVYTVYPGAGPEDVEKLVTKEVEDAVSTLNGLKNVSSTSSENLSLVMLELEYGTNVDIAHMDVKDNLELIAASLPDDAMDPTIMEINVDNLQHTISLSAIATGDVNLLSYVKDVIVPEFEKITGVASVDVYGGEESYIKVELNEERLKQYRLNPSTVADYLASADFSMPAGSVDKGELSLILRGGVSYNSVRSLNNIPIPVQNAGIIHLSDIAKVYETTYEKESISRYNGKDNVSIAIKKRQSADTLDITQAVIKTMEQLNAKDLGVSLSVISDSGDRIRESVSSVFTTLFVAMLLGMIVLFLFFGDWKASLIVGTSMPISVLLSLTLMNLMDIGFNVLTLGALIISIGNMVDNSIVVLDSCFSVREGRKSFKEAAIEGTRLVASSQIAGTAAGLVMFIPMALIQGLSGQMFFPFALTMSFSSISSVLSAMTVVPLLFSRLKPQEKKDIPIARFLRAAQKAYVKFLPKTLRHKPLVMLTAVGLLVGTVFITQFIHAELIPDSDEGTIAIEVNTKPGLKLEALDQILMQLEDVVAEHPDVETYSLTSSGGGMQSVMSSEPFSATLTAYLHDDRKTDTYDLVDTWRTQLRDIPDCDIKVSSRSQFSSMGGGSDIEVTLQGTNIEDLQKAAQLVEDVMAQHPNIIRYSSGSMQGDPQAEILVDPVKASAVGFTPIQVVGSVYNMVEGIKATDLNIDGTDYELRVEYPADRFQTISDISNIILISPTGRQVPLTDIAHIEYSTTPQSIKRQNNMYVQSVTAQPISANALVTKKEIQHAVKQLVFPEGVQLTDGQQSEQMKEEFSSMFTAILTAVLLIFIVLAMQFESIKFSLVVMLAIPFSLIGSFGLMWISGTTLSMLSLMGFLLLVGTVVNNSILLFDTTTIYQEEQGLSVEEALVLAGRSRMRPILMTTSISVISMIPDALSLGKTSEMQGMAIVIIGGLIAFTLLTLLLLPTFYMIMQKKKKSKEEDSDKLEDPNAAQPALNETLTK